LHVGASEKTQKHLVRFGDSPDLVQETSVDHFNDLRRLKDGLWPMFDNSVEHKDEIRATKVAAQITNVIRLEAEIAGDLQRHAIVNNNSLVVSSDEVRLRTVVLGAVRRHPEAAADLLAALRGLDAERNAQSADDVTYEVVDPAANNGTRGGPDASKGADLDLELGLRDLGNEAA
jgi:hypothetical protein